MCIPTFLQFIRHHTVCRILPSLYITSNFKACESRLHISEFLVDLSAVQEINSIMPIIINTWNNKDLHFWRSIIPWPLVIFLNIDISIYCKFNPENFQNERLLHIMYQCMRSLLLLCIYIVIISWFAYLL